MSRPRIPEPVNSSSTSDRLHPGDPDQLLRLSEVANLLALKSTQQVRDLIRTGVLIAVDVGAPRKLCQRISRRVRLGDIRAFIQSRRLGMGSGQ